MYTRYQIMVCLLKFDAFFLIGFSIQFLILVTGTPTAEFGESLSLTSASVLLPRVLTLFSYILSFDHHRSARLARRLGPLRGRSEKAFCPSSPVFRFPTS